MSPPRASSVEMFQEIKVMLGTTVALRPADYTRARSARPLEVRKQLA